MRIAKILITLSFLVLIACILLLTSSCRNDKKQGDKNYKQQELYVMHAGSLSIPFKKISEAFMQEYPGVKVKLEAGGSVANARKLTELNRHCDVFAVSDYKVIDKMLIPRHANYSIRFATNSMAIVFTEKSKYSKEINQHNWLEVLSREDVRFGRSDPNSDPCGYRAVMVLKLAEKMYNKPGITKKLLNKDTEHIRPKEVDLIALLESQNIDYVFIYKSVALQHHLKFIDLPDSIDLGNPSFNEFYGQAKVEIAGNEPGQTITQQGEAMVYGVTMPKNTKNKDQALQFLQFLLSKDKGLGIMEKNGQNSLATTAEKFYEKLPTTLKKKISEIQYK